MKRPIRREMAGRYWHGWASALRAYRMARTKKHGAGRSPVMHALKIAAGYRFIVDGQHRTPMRVPLYLRRFQGAGITRRASDQGRSDK